jgi:hypothetical protein
MCQLYGVVFYYFCSIYFIVVRFFIEFLFVFCSTFDFIQFFAFSLFIVRCSKEKIFNSDPGLYSRYFDPVVCEVPPLFIIIYAIKINIIHQTAPTLS